MLTILKDTVVVLVPQTLAEIEELATWKSLHNAAVLLVGQKAGSGLTLSVLGSRGDVLPEPINISVKATEPAARLISNFSASPFELDGRIYASVESFWQGLKFPSQTDRERIAELYGSAAKRAGDEVSYGPTITYGDVEIPVGTWRHWHLMERACWAKFSQNADAGEALKSTGERPIEHRMRRDSRSIPGVIMCQIWMRIRSALQQAYSRYSPAFGEEIE